MNLKSFLCTCACIVYFCAQISASSSIEKHLDHAGRFKHDPSSFRKHETQSSVSWLEELNVVIPACAPGAQEYIASEIGQTLSGKYGFANRVATDDEARIMMESIVLARRGCSEINKNVYAAKLPGVLSASSDLIKTHFSVLLGIDRATANYMRQLKGDYSYFNYLDSFSEYQKSAAMELLNRLDAGALSAIDAVVRDIWGSLPTTFKFEEVARVPLAPPSVPMPPSSTSSLSFVITLAMLHNILPAEIMSLVSKAFCGLRATDADVRQLASIYETPYQGDAGPLKPGEAWFSETEFERRLKTLPSQYANLVREFKWECQSRVEMVFQERIEACSSHKPSSAPFTSLVSQAVRPIRVILGNGVTITRQGGKYIYVGGGMTFNARQINFNGFILSSEFTEDQFLEAARGHGGIVEITYL